MCPEPTNDAGPEVMEGSPGGADASLFRAHFDRLPGPACVWRRVAQDFRLIAHNQAAGEWAGRGPSSVLSASAGALQGDYSDLVAQMRECVDTGVVKRSEIDYRDARGSMRRLAVTLVPVAAEILVQHTEDITDRHAAEQELRASEARTRALMQANPDMLMRVSRDGRYLDVHIPAKVRTGLTFGAERFLGHNVAELFEAEFAREHERHRIKALETGQVQFWHYARSLEGGKRYLEARFVPCGADEVLVTVTDATDRVNLERAIVNTVERERIRIGHDLHDGLGQLLTGVKLMLEPLRRRLAERESEDGKNVQQAVDLINRAIAQTSELARGLSPVPRDAGFTLVNALEQLAKRSEALFGISCRVAASDASQVLSEECSNNLYRIAQEAITNAVKHGNATDVELSCRGEGDRLMLTVEDNGTGTKGSAATAHGMGMSIMQYRARAIGGEVTIGCRPGGGTIVWCSFPMPAGSALRR